MLKLMKAYLPMCMLLAAVAGCQSMQWSRADTSEAQLQADSQNCQNKAMSTNQTARLQPNTPDGAKSSIAAQTEWQSCMRLLGYSAKARK